MLFHVHNSSFFVDFDKAGPNKTNICILHSSQVSDKFVYIYNGEMKEPLLLEEPRFNVDNVTQLVTKSGISLTCRVTQPEFYPPVKIT